MIYNVYIRIYDASRECGWTQVWIDSFAKYNDAVAFVMQYRSPNMLPDRMLAVTANKHDETYDESEPLLAVGMLEAGHPFEEDILTASYYIDDVFLQAASIVAVAPESISTLISTKSSRSLCLEW